MLKCTVFALLLFCGLRTTTMKFGKLVQNFQAEFEEEGSLPHLLDYKKLKKRLKTLTGAPSGLDGAAAGGEAGKVGDACDRIVFC